MSPMLGRPQPPDPDAFAAEVLNRLEPLFATARRLAGNRTDAEDLVQDTVVKALRFKDRFEPGTNLRAWLSTILHNTWRNRLRDASRERVTIDSPRVEAAAAAPGGPLVDDTPEQILLRQTLGDDVRRALDAVPDVFRQAVWLRDVEEFSYAEIARMLDVPIGTVMSRISRGRRLVLDMIRQSAADDRQPGTRGPAKEPETTPV